MNKTIIAMGDGGMDYKNPMMDLYILAQSNKKNPKICLLPTASGDNFNLVEGFKEIFSRYPCVPNVLTLFHPHTADIEGFLMEQDIIYVSGGHSKAMLGVWREYNLPSFLLKAYDNGTILSGGSAGSVCWFDQCITDSIYGSLTVMDGLKFLPYGNSPHFASKDRRISYAKYLSKGEIKEGYATDDYAALHFINGELYRCVSNRPESKTYRLYLDNKRPKMERLPTYYLGTEEYQNQFIFDTVLFEDYKNMEESMSLEDSKEEQEKLSE